MLFKFVSFLLLYLFVFLAISYLFDLFFTLWLANSSQLAKLSLLDSVRVDNVLVNIVNISLNQLKLILGLRGIYYFKNDFDKANDDEAEREKLIELVKTSGEVTRDELINLNNIECTTDCDTQRSEYNHLKYFSSAKLMEEEIDDNHVWLLYVRHDDTEQNYDWSKLVKRFNKFNFRFARFDCSSDPLYCRQRRWFSSQLVFAFPRTGSETVDKKLIYNYSLRSNVQVDNIIPWLQKQLETQLSYIDNINVLESHWLEQNRLNKNNKKLVKMVTIMGSQFRNNPPLTLALLALQFRERIQFGVYFASTEQLAKFHTRFRTNISPQLPIYLLTHQQELIVLNQNNFEPLSYTQVDAYLRGLFPELNDIYLVLFSLLNLCLGLNFFWTRCMTASKHLRLCLVKAFEMNLTITFCTIATPMLLNRVFAMFNFILPQNVILLLNEQVTSFLQSLWSSKLAFYFRSQLLSPFAFERYFLAFVITGFVLVTIRRNRFSRMRLLQNLCNDYDDELIKSVFIWASNIGCFIGFILFRNTTRIRRRNVHISTNSLQHGNGLSGDSNATASQTIGSPANNLIEDSIDDNEEYEDELELDEYIDLDADLDRLLIESLFTMPNLWLKTELISNDYINQLPIWQYTQVTQSPPVPQYTSNSSATDSSDNEEQFFQSNSIESTSNFDCQTVSVADYSNSSKEAPEGCSSNMSESCSKSQSVPSFSPQISAKIEEKKRIIRMRRKRNKRVCSNEVGHNASVAEVINVSCKPSESETLKPQWMLDFNDCTICLDAYKHTQTICGLPCGHNYHNDCIIQWLIRGNHCCPICRWPSYRLKHPRQVKCN